MKLQEISKKDFLGRLKGDSHTLVRDVLRQVRKEEFSKDKGVKLTYKVNMHRSKYSIYVHFMPFAQMLQYNTNIDQTGVSQQREAQVSLGVMRMKKLLQQAFPNEGTKRTQIVVNPIRHGEAYLITVWVF